LTRRHIFGNALRIFLIILVLLGNDVKADNAMKSDESLQQKLLEYILANIELNDK
jgi:hypothetical protein